jgi:hypothetical protein
MLLIAATYCYFLIQVLNDQVHFNQRFAPARFLLTSILKGVCSLKIADLLSELQLFINS